MVLGWWGENGLLLPQACERLVVTKRTGLPNAIQNLSPCFHPRGYDLGGRGFHEILEGLQEKSSGHVDNEKRKDEGTDWVHP